MKGLLIKDLRLMLHQKKFFIALLLFSILINSQTDGMFVIGYLSFVCLTFVLNTITYDESDNGYLFLMTLPALRKTFAREKYLFAFLLTGGAWLVSVIIAFGFKIMTAEGGFLVQDFILEAIIFIPILFVLVAVKLQLEFKFGAQKGRIATVCALGGVVLLGVIMFKGMEVSGITLEMLDSLLIGRQWFIVILAFVAAAVINIISCMISVRIVRQKEF